MMVMEGMRGRRSFINEANPFTPSQWQELEDQALIFKCLHFGWPVPSHLLLSIRRSCFLSSPPQPSMGFFSPHSSWGWGSFQLGLKGKEEDPEPGRCRRTDGKKWRCSRRACPDSKYCERHLHRGKNRLRKLLDSSPQRSKTSSVLPSPLSLLPPVIKKLRYFHGLEDKGIEQNSSSEISAFSINKIKQSTYSEIEKEEEKPRALQFFFVKGIESEQGLIEEERLSASSSGSPMALPLVLDLNV